MKYFYITVDGEERRHKFSAAEWAAYEWVCLTIWGGLPYDVTWAVGTHIYQRALLKYNEQLNKGDVGSD